MRGHVRHPPALEACRRERRLNLTADERDSANKERHAWTQTHTSTRTTHHNTPHHTTPHHTTTQRRNKTDGRARDQGKQREKSLMYNLECSGKEKGAGL